MKKLLFTLVLSLLFTVLAYTANQMNREQVGLIGQVQVITTEEAKISHKFGEWVEKSRIKVSRHVYDIKGNLTEQTEYDDDGSIDEKQVYAYDDKGNLTEKTEYDDDGSIDEKWVYTYKFDTTGNWVEKTISKSVDEFGKSYLKPLKIIYRTITYH